MAKDALKSLMDRVARSRVWRSFFRHGWPDSEMNRSLTTTSNIFFHLHPVKVSRRSIRPTYSWGLGVISIILFVILGLTGVLLTFYYVPSVEQAHSDMLELQMGIPFGQFLRNMHRWAAHLMVLVVVLHLLRVFYTGAYKPPREFNWVVGVFLGLFTMFASFTGYLLPWDQLSYWAITVGTSIAAYAPLVGEEVRSILLGGPEVGQNALTRFYSLHVLVVPLFLILGISLHIWRVRKDGGLAAQGKKEDRLDILD